ncbi:MAG: DUF2264 domain-containing protein [Treponema sp.]|nr:DUF2264 domain-containing protein [Treponema sp.]
MLCRNPLLNRDDLQQNLLELLSPLKNHVVPGGYHLGNTGARNDCKIASIEGFARTLWGIAPFVAGGGDYSEIELVHSVLKEGTNPDCGGYWGESGNADQRLVEMAPIALFLLLTQKTFWDILSQKEKGNIYRWLSFIEKRELPPNNWHFFRILVCACFRELGLPVNENAEKESFDLIESLYRADGWYEDGSAGNFDLYNPMGFHYYGLIWAKLAGAHNLQYSERYIERALLFSKNFTSWFTSSGESVPYGRSLCYRFGAVSFFSACAFADLPVLPWGELKGFFLRNLRSWFSLPITDNGGILSVGYNYPNLIMSEIYNSPGSPYWGLKAWIVLALKEDHPFWKAEEAPYKQSEVSSRSKIYDDNIALCDTGKINVLTDKVPGFIICNSGEDAQLFSSGKNSIKYEMNNNAAKYSKFVYSAKAGFCVSLGNYGLETAACDSSLVLSEGDNFWRNRNDVSNVRVGQTSGNFGWVSSLWQPWNDVKVTTILVCAGIWHLRFHRIESGRVLQSAEGGFSVSRFIEPWVQGKLKVHPENPGNPEKNEDYPANNHAQKDHETLVSFPWGASCILGMEENSKRTGRVLIPSPNLNILFPNTAIPILEGNLKKGITVLVSAVCRSAEMEIRYQPPTVEAKDDGSFLINNSLEVFFDLKTAQIWAKSVSSLN